MYINLPPNAKIITDRYQSDRQELIRIIKSLLEQGLPRGKPIPVEGEDPSTDEGWRCGYHLYRYQLLRELADEYEAEDASYDASKKKHT